MVPRLVIPTTFTAVDRFSAPVMRMRGALGAFVASSEIGLARVERGFRRMMSPLVGLQNTLRGLGFYVGLFSFVLLMRSAVGVMADFEQAQINIKAVNPGDNIKKMADQARVLSLKYGEAAKSVLEIDLALRKLGFQESDVLKMSAPILTGSVALRANPEELSKTAGAILQAMKMPASETQNVIDKLAKSADLSAMDWSDLQTMLPRAMQSASLAGLNLNQLLSLFAMARNAQVHVASGSVAIKNMLIKGAIWNKDMNTMLNMIVDSPDKIKRAYKMFGSKTLVTALPLAEAQRLGSVEAFEKQLEASYSGYAEQVASIRLDSIRGKLTLFKRSYEELVLSIDDGRGPIGKALKQYLDVASAMMLMAADSDAARSRMEQMEPTVLSLASKYTTWLKVIMYVTGAIIAMRVALILWNAVVVISKVVMFAYSVALAVATALGWGNVFALRANIVAMGALRAIMAVVTAAQWLWNAAMAANPIGLIVILVALLLAYITILIVKWDEWGAALAVFLGPLGLIIGAIIQIIRKWDEIKKAFTDGGFIDGIKALGKAILDGVLYPFQKLFEILGRIKGFGFFSRAATEIDNFRNGMWSPPDSSISGGSSMQEVIRPVQYEPSYNGDSLSQSRVSIDINNRSGFSVAAKSDSAKINMKPESTFWQPFNDKTFDGF